MRFWRSKETRVVIAGGSHAAAVRNALDGFEPRGGHLHFEAYFYAKPRQKERLGAIAGALDPKAMAKMVAGLGANVHFVSMLRGNFHHTVAMAEHPEPFDFILQGDGESVEAGRRLIPFRAMEAFFEDQLRASCAPLWQAREQKQGPVYYVMAPPPKEHVDQLLEQGGNAGKWQAVLEHGVAPASLRLKCWQLQQRVMRKLCAEQDITFIPVPEGSQCQKGFLKPDYCLEDATHANSAYGVLVLRQLETLIGSPQADGQETGGVV